MSIWLSRWFGRDDEITPWGEVGGMGKQDWSDAVPNVDGETFREFYARKWGEPWPVHGQQVHAPITMLRNVAEASADWMDALAKRGKQ